ncbi:MAG: hypothetical protein HYU69_06025 [Bacteroidetes bacterium]|nr:hypothetical protein [Bacteroidota bacterium]
MGASNKLHELIHSMSMNEKRYFKINTAGNAGGQDSTYLKLFNLIAAQKKYNEYKIKSGFDTRAQKDLPVMKNYLYNLILKKLCSYNASSHIEIQLHDQLNEAFVLFQKGLYNHYEKKLKKIKAIATRYSKPEILLEIYNRELKLIHFREDLSAMEDKYGTLQRESAEIINKINNRNQYYSLKNNMYLLLRKAGVSKNKQTEYEYGHLMKNSLMENKTQPLSPESKLSYYDIKAAYYTFGKTDPLKSIAALESKYELLQLLPEKDHELIISRANTLINLSISYYTLNNIRKAFEMMRNLEHELEKWEKKLPSHIYLRITFTLHKIRATLFISMGNFKDGLYELNLEEELLPFDNTINNIHDFYFTKAYTHFALKQYTNSLSSINILLNSSTLKEQDKFYRRTKFLQLQLYFEMGKTDLIEHEASMITRLHKNKAYVSKAEKLAFDFILNDIHALTSQKQLKERCSLVKKQFEYLKKYPKEKSAIEELNILDWIESKIQNRSLTEIVQEKAKRLEK